ncbi:MAG: TonB-dependent receptor [bacterium]
MWTNKIVKIVTVVSLACMVQMGVQAAEQEIEEVVVTAQKREQAVQSIPISIKVLLGDMLETVNADSLDDITRLVPSMSMTDLSRGGNNVQIRGLGSNVASVGTVAIYNDGIISANRIQSSGTFAEQDSALYDVERIEVLRGPQGTLYGEGSFGGVINILSRRPNAEKFEASFSGTWFDTDEGSSNNADYAGMVNIPLVQDKLAVRLVAFDYDHEGYIDAVNVLPLFFGGPPEMVGEDANTEGVTGGRIMVQWSPTETFDATLIYKSEEADIGISNFDSPNLMGTVNSLAGTSFATDLTQAVFSPTFGTETETTETILEINIDLPMGTLTSITGFGEVDIQSLSGLKSSGEAFSEEIRLASTAGRAFDWIVGAYFRSAEKDINFNGSAFRGDELDQWSVFGEIYWPLIQDVTATLGLRYAEHDVDVDDRLNGLATVSDSFDNISPKIAIDWQLSEDTLVYGSITSGFRAGGANADESLGTDPSYSVGFDADEIWNYEIGMKSALWQSMVTVNAALFYIDWTDIQIDKAITSVVSPPVQFIVVNGNDAHSFGFETDITIRPAEGWEIVLGGSVLEAEYDGGVIDSASIGLGIPIDGMTLPNTPEWLFNASVEKSFEIGSTGIDAYVRGDYTARDSSFADVPNDPPPGGDFESGSFEMFNLRGGLRRNNWEVQLFATNLLDEEGSSFNFFDGGFGDVHVFLRPRTVGVNLKFRTN